MDNGIFAELTLPTGKMRNRFTSERKKLSQRTPPTQDFQVFNDMAIYVAATGTEFRLICTPPGSNVGSLMNISDSEPVSIGKSKISTRNWNLME
ncbi:MAG TPA: hypothetical protein VFE47_30840 [Tepidisphaeraceae bacterium]|jgi:hypothetical protein|nr:hypothetical protein [Tepidisphaeraceae bacterium]